VVFEEAAKIKARNVTYEPKWVAITDYYHTVLKEPMNKRKAMDERPCLTKEQYSLVSSTLFLFSRLCHDFTVWFSNAMLLLFR
jgi:hypothetical protein